MDFGRSLGAANSRMDSAGILREKRVNFSDRFRRVRGALFRRPKNSRSQRSFSFSLKFATEVRKVRAKIRAQNRDQNSRQRSCAKIDAKKYSSSKVNLLYL